jgi:integrase/recombinase XerD
MVMYACGLRISEAVTLQVTAIDKTNMVLRVIGKGNTERHVTLPQPVHEELRKIWLTHRHPQWVFPNRRHTGPLDSDTLQRTFRYVADQAKIPGATSHSLRHSYASRLFEEKVEAPVVQKLLGHADISTTTIYTHLTEATQAALRRLLNKLMTGL